MQVLQSAFGNSVFGGKEAGTGHSTQLAVLFTGRAWASLDCVSLAGQPIRVPAQPVAEPGVPMVQYVGGHKQLVAAHSLHAAKRLHEVEEVQPHPLGKVLSGPELAAQLLLQHGKRLQADAYLRKARGAGPGRHTVWRVWPAQRQHIRRVCVGNKPSVAPVCSPNADIQCQPHVWGENALCRQKKGNLQRINGGEGGG